VLRAGARAQADDPRARLKRAVAARLVRVGQCDNVAGPRFDVLLAELEAARPVTTT
jgi:hypothetical protein